MRISGLGRVTPSMALWSVAFPHAGKQNLSFLLEPVRSRSPLAGALLNVQAQLRAGKGQQLRCTASEMGRRECLRQESLLKVCL